MAFLLEDLQLKSTSAIDIQPSISCLPSELLDQIISFAAARDRVALCRVSRTFNSLSIRYIYHQICLDTPERVFLCFRTLAEVPGRVKLVKGLDVYVRFTRRNPTGLTKNYDVMKRGFAGLSQIESLRWVYPSRSYIDVIAQCTFPLLDRLDSELELTQPFVNFLNRHPQLTHLQLNRQHPLAAGDFSHLSPLDLPNLRSFVGDAIYVPLVVQSSPTLRAVVPLFNGVDDDPRPALDALVESSSGTLNVLCCRRRGWNLDLLEAISVRLPDIALLDLTNVLIIESFPTLETIETIRSILTRFHRLEKFFFGCMNTFQLGEVADHLDEDFETVISWGNACPTLYEITLPYSPRWMRVNEQVWLPDPSDERGAEWLKKRMGDFRD